MRAIWAEARTLLAYERIAAARSQATFLVTQPEVQRFAELAPESAHKVDAIEMEVHLDSFAPNLDLPCPYSAPGPHIVFTGNMDYWPNADAATWFAHEILPELQGKRPGTCFHVVGNRPGPDILALAKHPGINVTGRVPDVRPYVAHADVSVGTLRMARGVQNKVLEAMALGKPVVASPQAFEGIKAVAGRDLLVADGAAETTAAVLSILNGEHPDLGLAARAAMERSYSWDTQFPEARRLDRPNRLAERRSWARGLIKRRIPAITAERLRPLPRLGAAFRNILRRPAITAGAAGDCYDHAIRSTFSAPQFSPGSAR